MKYLRLSAVALVVAPLVAGCAAGSVDTATTTSADTASAALTADQVAAIKAQIRSIAFANLGRTDNWAETRAELDPLVQQLAGDYGDKPATDSLPLVKGAWRQIFSDFPYPPMGPISQDQKAIYQVVTDKGYYYNLGNSKAFGFLPLTGVLRGKYAVDNDQLDIEFTRVGFRFGDLDKKRNLEELVDKLEAGKEYILDIPGGGKAPNGPVGIGGTLKTLYVDADFRIASGTQKDFTDSSGKVVRPGSAGGIFILDRVETPVD